MHPQLPGLSASPPLQRFYGAVAIGLVALAVPVAGADFDVLPTLETPPAPSGGDAADDAAIWVHPTDRSLSVVVGTDKDPSDSGTGGLIVYDLSGAVLSSVTGFRANNVDLRYNFPLGAGVVDLIATTDRSNDQIAFYSLDAGTRTLGAVGTLATGFADPYGIALYRSPVSGKFYVFASEEAAANRGTIKQWELSGGGGVVTGALVRSWDVGTSSVEGLVADDQHGFLYLGEEDVGIWRYGAEPTAGTGTGDRFQVDSTSGGGDLTADVEGLTLFQRRDGGGYLIASSQGESEFNLYERTGSNARVGSLRIIANAGAGVDGVSDTDGVEVVSTGLGGAFASGLLVVQDGVNTSPSEGTDFKYVDWADLVTAADGVGIDLTSDPDWDPRVAVPEPRASALIALVLGGAAMFKRRLGRAARA
jgi:3-phytase